MGLGANAMKQNVLAKRALTNLREALERDLRLRAPIPVENLADPIDRFLAAIERDASLTYQHLAVKRYREVVAALKRIETGEYGTCEECAEPIGQARLQAVPYALRCRRCQERLERFAA